MKSREERKREMRSKTEGQMGRNEKTSELGERQGEAKRGQRDGQETTGGKRRSREQTEVEEMRGEKRIR